jgi:hypothetical protein
LEKTQFYSPLKIGLLIVSIAYFLFTFHVMFTLSWIGEWESLGETVGFVIFVEDISANIGLIFRFVGSLTALVGMILYFAKKGLSAQTTSKILRVVLVAEAIYWLPLFVSGALPLFYMSDFGNSSLIAVLSSLITSEVPCLVESTAIPIALLVLAYKLNPKKPLKGAIKWGLISGTAYIFVFWLVYMSIWIVTIMQKGTGYLTSYPENLFSFALTTFGLLALALFSAYFTKKSSGAESLEALKKKTIGGIIIALGLYFLWNYLTWIFFGGDALWSAWYAWFLGHNMDLWLLSVPLVGVPLLLEHKASKSAKTTR